MKFIRYLLLLVLLGTIMTGCHSLQRMHMDVFGSEEKFPYSNNPRLKDDVFFLYPEKKRSYSSSSRHKRRKLTPLAIRNLKKLIPTDKIRTWPPLLVHDVKASPFYFTQITITVTNRTVLPVMSFAYTYVGVLRRKGKQYCYQQYNIPAENDKPARSIYKKRLLPEYIKTYHVYWFRHNIQPGHTVTIKAVKNKDRFGHDKVAGTIVIPFPGFCNHFFLREKLEPDEPPTFEQYYDDKIYKTFYEEVRNYRNNHYNYVQFYSAIVPLWLAPGTNRVIRGNSQQGNDYRYNHSYGDQHE